jgi:hypothetical protein
VIVELREQLLAPERELDEWENTLLTRENGMVEAEHFPRRARMECVSAYKTPNSWRCCQST